MSISKGGQSVKPYVGSKEVKEAYVGSQLVYRATPPYVYGFLGGQDNYVLAGWCSLSSNGAAITKEGSNFRIALSSYYQFGSWNYGEVLISKPAEAGNTLSFMVKAGGTKTPQMNVSKVEGARRIKISSFEPTSEWSLVSVNIPDNTQVAITLGDFYAEYDITYYDVIRYEVK